MVVRTEFRAGEREASVGEEGVRGGVGAWREGVELGVGGAGARGAEAEHGGAQVVERGVEGK